MTIYDKGCISNYRNCSLCYVCYSVLYRMLTDNNDSIIKTLCLTKEEKDISFLIEADDWLEL